MSKKRNSLWELVFYRSAAFAALAMVIQFGLVFHEYWSDETKLVRKILLDETNQVAAGLTRVNGTGAFEVPKGLRDRYRSLTAGARPITSGYFVKIDDEAGRTIFTNCGGDTCNNFFNHDTAHMPDYWFHVIKPGKPLNFVGGRRVFVSDQAFQVSIANLSDPDKLIFYALGQEMWSHLIAPMSIMLLLVIGATTLSIRTMLEPVRQASDKVSKIDPNISTVELDTSKMPEEIAQFSEAINRSFRRIGELIKGQKLYASAISHEIRTPVSIIRLELEDIDHPQVKKALGDLDNLTHLLNQLTVLAKMDAVDPNDFRSIELVALVEKVALDMAPYVYGKSKSLEFQKTGEAWVVAVPYLVETLVRNLVENSVKHTPPGTHITVSAGRGAILSVSDDGPGFTPPSGQVRGLNGLLKRGDGLGVGLNIVSEIAKLHQAEVITKSGLGSGSLIEVRFQPETGIHSA